MARSCFSVITLSPWTRNAKMSQTKQKIELCSLHVGWSPEFQKKAVFSWSTVSKATRWPHYHFVVFEAAYRVFSLTCPASMQIYWNKKKWLTSEKSSTPTGFVWNTNMAGPGYSIVSLFRFFLCPLRAGRWELYNTESHSVTHPVS